MNPFPAKTLSHDFWELEREMETFAGELKREIRMLVAAVRRRIENPNHYCLWGARKGYIQIGSFEDQRPWLAMAAALKATMVWGISSAEALRQIGTALERLNENMQRKRSA